MLPGMKSCLRNGIVVLGILASVGTVERATAQGGGKKTFKVSEFTFVRPDAWGWVQPRSLMRKAQLSVPGKEGGEKGEVVFFHFGPGNAGGTQANIDRWFRQFQEPKAQLNARTETSKVGDTPISFVHAEGTYLSGPPVGRKIPKRNFALLGAIVEAEQGFVFIKFTGPKAVVSAAESDFKTMVASAK
ncbi:MAG: hypothetical protein M2R45_00556 [Verrucomicrobia subdivision 3 bacterium]|nr:hypothetical protein [Limisphaerales bacterium]MCS1413566.1 hypothetical protein [Limisphaerales bacterium]